MSALVTFRCARMPSYQYPRSLVAQFPEDVYRNAGASDVLPLVMKNLDADKVLAVQFLRAGRVRLTFQDPETCAQVLKEGLDLEFSVDLFPADYRLRTVHLRDLPVEIEEEVVLSFLAGFGEVLSVNHCFFDDYPSVRNGNRVSKVLLDRDIPQFVEIDGCNCRVWYPGRPPQCSVCREFGHRAPTCPLSGRCWRCRQPGHMARECTQAWGPSFSVSRTNHSMEVEDDSDTSSSASEDVPSTTASVTSPVVTSPPVISTCPPVTSVRSTAAVPTSCLTVTVTAPLKSSTGPVTMTTAASVTVPSASVKVPTASAPESSNSDASTASFQDLKNLVLFSLVGFSVRALPTIIRLLNYRALIPNNFQLLPNSPLAETKSGALMIIHLFIFAILYPYALDPINFP